LKVDRAARRTFCRDNHPHRTEHWLEICEIAEWFRVPLSAEDDEPICAVSRDDFLRSSTAGFEFSAPFLKTWDVAHWKPRVGRTSLSISTITIRAREGWTLLRSVVNVLV